MLCPISHSCSVPLPVSLLCDGLPAVLCLGRSCVRGGPRFVDRYTTSMVCAAMPIEFAQPYILYRSVLLCPQAEYPERPAY